MARSALQSCVAVSLRSTSGRETHGIPVVCGGDGLEALLPCSVEQLQLDLLLVQLDRPQLEVNPDRWCAVHVCMSTPGDAARELSALQGSPRGGRSQLSIKYRNRGCTDRASVGGGRSPNESSENRSSSEDLPTPGGVSRIRAMYGAARDREGQGVRGRMLTTVADEHELDKVVIRVATLPRRACHLSS